MSTEDLYNNSRPSIDLTMQSAAYVYREKLVGILLSGANKDGALGMKNIVTKGGLTIIQDPAECLIDTMPTSVLKLTKVDHILRVDAIVEFLLELNKKIKTKAI
jgi:two-component system chemotaxis response regulator CheB